MLQSLQLFSAGLTNAMSLGKCITVAIVACQAPSKVVGQVKVGTQCCVPLADKSVGCSFKAQSVSRSVQTTEAVDESSSTSASRPSISPSKAKGGNSIQGCLHSCPLCDYETNKLWCMKVHARIHTGERLFECHLCLQTFSQRNSLNRHLRVHVGEQPFRCPSCPRTFSDMPTMKQHLCTHTSKKPFQCPSCPRTFKQKSRMQSHLRIHTGDRPYRCTVCSMTFRWHGCLRTHKRKHQDTIV
ncbi:zinc finger protein 239-like [Dermacentor silvarum]|uniref:zinc finger protein 239-like n=1 Tax=Dermacentor silvarum TaxID=543639 RepID=UPI002100A72B|nr:zinc finger protein 239-like [Dermacentor silvarum]